MIDDLIIFDDDHDPGGKVHLAMPDDVISDAVYSNCHQYRYILHRRWQPERRDHSIMFIMLNPSTATEQVDDPTVRKCRNYAIRWGYNHLIVGNLMAYRATDPSLLRGVGDPIGPETLQHLRQAIETYVPTIVCAWGCLPGRLRHVETPVLDLLRQMHVQPFVLRLNSGGSPAHPLYLPMHTDPIEWGI